MRKEEELKLQKQFLEEQKRKLQDLTPSMKVESKNEEKKPPLVVKGSMAFQINFEEMTSEAGEEVNKSFAIGFDNSAPAQIIAIQQVIGMMEQILATEMKLRVKHASVPELHKKNVLRFSNKDFDSLRKTQQYLHQWRDEVVEQVYQQCKQSNPGEKLIIVPATALTGM